MNMKTELVLQMFPLLRRVPAFAPEMRKMRDGEEDREQFSRKYAFLGSRSRYAHVSAEIIPNPAKLAAELASKPFFGPEFITARGQTYNAGRNKTKREHRAIHGVRK